MGNTNLHQPKEKWDSKIYFRLQIIKYMLGQKALSNPPNSICSPDIRGNQLYHITGTQHELQLGICLLLDCFCTNPSVPMHWWCISVQGYPDYGYLLQINPYIILPLNKIE